MLSILVGILGRVSFGTIFLRGLMWAALFGAGTLGVSVLGRRFLPELFQQGQTQNTRPADEDSAGIDITIEESNPHGAADAESAAEPPGEDSIASADEAELGAAYEGLDGDIDEAEEIEELPSVTDGIDEFADASADTGGELPSMDGADLAFGGSGTDTGSTPSLERVDVMGVEEDPEIVAKAVRTLMKKDQEG